MATKTGLLLTKTVRGNARSLGKVDGNKLLSVVLEGLKNSPQFKMPFLKRGAFLTSILENKDSMDTLSATVGVLVCRGVQSAVLGVLQTF